MIEMVTVAGRRWQLRVIEHARLRMVQRGIRMETVLSLFAQFVEQAATEGQEIIAGAYTIRARSSGIGCGLM